MQASSRAGKDRIIMERSKSGAAPCWCLASVCLDDAIPRMVVHYKHLRFEHSTIRMASPTHDVSLIDMNTGRILKIP